MKAVKAIITGLMIATAFIIVKILYSPLMFRGSTYGMPALIEDGSVDNLFIGSSTFRQGLDIDILDTNGEDNYILTYNACQPAIDALLLEELIEHDVQIKNLYVDMHVYSMYWPPTIEDEKLILESNVQLKKKLYHLTQEDSLFNRFNYYVTGGNTVVIAWPINFFLFNMQFKNGGTLSFSQGISQEEIDSYYMGIPNREFDSEQVRGVYRIIQLCRENNIRLSFLEIPKAGNIMSTASYEDAFTKYEQLLDSNMMIRIEGFDVHNPEYFSDRVHLSTKGRKELTRLLMEAIY